MNDMDKVVELHMRCFPNFFLTSLGERFLREYYGELLRNKRSVAVALEGKLGDIQGFVTGVISPSGFYRELLRKRWHKFFLASILVAIRNPLVIPRLFRSFSKPDMADNRADIAELTSICILPEFQGLGYGKLLIRAFEHEISKRGCNEIVLFTDAVGNQKANTFYVNQGFHVAKTYKTPEGRVMNEYRKHNLSNEKSTFP